MQESTNERRDQVRLGERSARWLGGALAITVALATTAPRGVEAQQAQPQVIVVPTQQPQPQPQPVYVQTQPQYVVAQPGYAPVAPPPRQRGGGSHIGLIVSGAVLLGVGWIANFIVGLPAGDDPFRSGAEPEWEAFRYSSFIPIAGPWVQIGVKPTSFTQDYWAIWLIIDGLLQATGTALLIAGIATSGGDDGDLADAGDGLELMVLPNASPDGAGLTLVGRF